MRGSNKRIWTEEEQQRYKALYASGSSVRSLAAMAKCHPNTIRSMLTGEYPSAPRNPLAHGFTDEELNEASRLMESGMKAIEVAKKYGRTQSWGHNVLWRVRTDDGGCAGPIVAARKAGREKIKKEIAWPDFSAHNLSEKFTKIAENRLSLRLEGWKI